MGDSEHEVRLAPSALRHWFEMDDLDARAEVHAILEELRLSGTAPRTYSLLNGPEHRTYGRLVKVVFHLDREKRRVSITDVVLR